MKLQELKIGEPAHSALHGIGVESLEDCTKYTKNELLSLHGVGPKAIRIIEEELMKQNLSLKK